MVNWCTISDVVTRTSRVYDNECSSFRDFFSIDSHTDYLIRKSESRCLTTRNVFVRQCKSVLNSWFNQLSLKGGSIFTSVLCLCHRDLQWRNGLFTMNANFPLRKNFSVKPEAVCKTGDIFWGFDYRRLLTPHITAVLKGENVDFLRNTARFYRPNFRVWSGKKWAVSIYPMDSSQPNVSTIQAKGLIVFLTLQNLSNRKEKSLIVSRVCLPVQKLKSAMKILHSRYARLQVINGNKSCLLRSYTTRKWNFCRTFYL